METATVELDADELVGLVEIAIRKSRVGSLPHLIREWATGAAEVVEQQKREIERLESEVESFRRHLTDTVVGRSN